MMRAMLHMLLTVTMLMTSIGAASARGAAPAVDHVVICSVYRRDPVTVYVKVAFDKHEDPSRTCVSPRTLPPRARGGKTGDESVLQIDYT